MHEIVKDCYGKLLQTSDDLKTSACCDAFGNRRSEKVKIKLTVESNPIEIQIGLLNLTYNIKRVAFLTRKKHWNFDRVIAPAAS